MLKYIKFTHQGNSIMMRFSSLLFGLVLSFQAAAVQPMVVYYESWQGESTAQDIENLPAYVSHLALAFAKPNASYHGNVDLTCTGLNLPYSGNQLKEAIKKAKENNPALKVLLAVGGATYHEWQNLRPIDLSQLVEDLGLDGIDIDYEQAPPDAALVNAVTKDLRQALAADKILTMAVMHVAAYGRDQWEHSQPMGSEWTGFLHQIQPSLDDIDMINVMSYDAGTSYDVNEAYEAFRHYYDGVIAMGMQVAPEAWGDHRWTTEKVESLADIIKNRSETDGFMLWSMHKNNELVSDTDPDWPSANLLGTTACNSLSLSDTSICALPLMPTKNSNLIFRNDAYHDNSVYFIVDAMPYGYPHTPTLNSGDSATLTGEDIPITGDIPIFVYSDAISYETPCIDERTGQAMSLAWKPNDMTWQVNFWLDTNKTPICSAQNN